MTTRSLPAAIMSDLAGLRERVAKATGADRELDDAILAATNPHKTGPYSSWRAAASAFRWNVDVTGSADAALALVERVLPGADLDLCKRSGPSPWRVLRYVPDGRHWLRTDAPTPPLAILAALLQALEQTR